MLVRQQVRQQVRLGVVNVSVGMRGRAGVVTTWRAAAVSPREVLPFCRRRFASGAIIRGFAAAPGPAVGDPEKALKALKSLAETDETRTSTTTGTDVIANLSTPPTAKGDVNKSKETQEDATEEKPRDKKADDGKPNDEKPNDPKPKGGKPNNKEEKGRWERFLGVSANVIALVGAVAAWRATVISRDAIEISRESSANQLHSNEKLAVSAKRKIDEPEVVFQKNVATAVASLCETFAYEDGMHLEVSMVEDSGAAKYVQEWALRYLEKGIKVPPRAERMITSTERIKFSPQVLEGDSGTGKSTALLRLLRDRGGPGAST